MLLIGIILLVLSLLSILFIFIIKKDSKESEGIVPSAVLGGTTTLFFILGICAISEYCSPSITPIDVYRGKTTLEITYKDSIAIDSTVVWKEEVK